MRQSFQSCLLILPAVLMVVGSGVRATASSGEVFDSTSGLGEVEAWDMMGQVGQSSGQNPEEEVYSRESSSSSECPEVEQNHQGFPTITFQDENVPALTINVTGNTVFSREELRDAVSEVTEPLGKRYVTVRFLLTAPEKYTRWEGFADLNNFLQQELPDDVAGAITSLYTTNDYITSKAKAESLENGVVEICTIEGRLAEIQVFEIINSQESSEADIEGGDSNEEFEEAEASRRWASYIRKRIQLGVDTPLNTADIEDQLRLLREDPIIESIEASLLATSTEEQPGTEGQSILRVRFTKANPFELSLGADNYSPPSVGSERLGANLVYRNLAVIGDEISFFGSATLGSQVFDLSYQHPLNAMNGTLQLRMAPNINDVVQSEFDDLDIRGETELYEISYRQPLVRKPNEEFALDWGFTFQDGQTFIFDSLGIPFGIGPDEDGVSRTSVIKFGQDYLHRSSQGALFLRSQFSFGTGLFDATANEGSIPDGQFFSWLGQAQRVQRIARNHLLIVRAELQLTPHSLLPAQQFVIGGGQSVRGYRQNVRSGDNGFRFSIEDRITLKRDDVNNSSLLLAPFFDTGVVWNHPDNPNELPSEAFLAGLGLAVIWLPEPIPGLELRVDYGLPLVVLDDRSDNIQDDGFYFSVRYGF